MPNGNTYRIEALHRGLQALLAFLEHPEMTFSEFKTELDLSNATAKRVLFTLCENQLLRFDAERSRYSLGVKAFELGVMAAKTHAILQASIKFMDTIAQEVGETVILAERTDSEQLYLHKTEPLGSLKELTPIGSRQPLYYGLGRAILAFMDRSVWEQYVPSEIPAYSMHTVVDRDAFIADLERVRLKGYAVEKRQYREGVVGVGVPIIPHQNQPWGFIGVALPANRFNDEKEKELANLLTRAAKAIILRTSNQG